MRLHLVVSNPWKHSRAWAVSQADLLHSRRIRLPFPAVNSIILRMSGERGCGRTMR
jgi:hypothetical protein